MASEFKVRLPKELDFALEADNTKRCREIFQHNQNVTVPRVFDEYTKQRVLVMSFEKGISVSKVRQMHEAGIDLRRLA